MIQLSERLNAMEESATLAMARLSRELKAQGKDIISLSLGEPDFHTPLFIKDAAIQAINDNYTTYTPVAGYDDLREAIAKKFLRDKYGSLAFFTSRTLSSGFSKLSKKEKSGK